MTVSGVSVVMSTFNRGHYLARSLECYAQQRLTVPVELVIVNDGSNDDTSEVIDRWCPHLDIKEIKLRKFDGRWRDCAMTINIGLRAAKYSLIAATHPEVMPGPQTLDAMYWIYSQMQSPTAYIAAKIYYLTPADQEALDSVPWRIQGATAVRMLPNFYEEESAEHQKLSDYSHRAMDRHDRWESWVFGAMSRHTWDWFGGMRERPEWGTVDMDFHNRRKVLGIETITLMSPTSFCVHQNHDVPGRPTDVPTPRDMTAAFAGMPKEAYTPQNSRLSHL